jgi:hypothetical protein
MVIDALHQGERCWFMKAHDGALRELARIATARPYRPLAG